MNAMTKVWAGLTFCLGVMFVIPHNSWSQTPSTNCTKPRNWSGQDDNNSSKDAPNCYRDALDLKYSTSILIRGYMQRLLTPTDHVDFYYYDYGKSSLDLNTSYCVEFTSNSGAPSPVPLSNLKFYVWKGSYGSSFSAPTLVGQVTATKGIGFNPTSRARYFFSLELSGSTNGGQYAFKISKKNCGGTTTPTAQLDYEPTSAYKNDSYSGTRGIAGSDGKGVALRRTGDSFPLGTGGNTTTQSGSTFSFIVRSTVKPKYTFDLKLYLRKGTGTWKTWNMNQNVSFTAPSSDPFKYRFYTYIGCSTSAGTSTIGPGNDYQYYFRLSYNGKVITLPPQAASGRYLDAPDCNVSTDTEAPKSSATSPATSKDNTFNVGFTSKDGPTGSASGVKSTTLWYRKDGGAWKKAPNSAQSGTSGNFKFTAPDGEGKYDFYTQSTDNKGNTESNPSSSTQPSSSTVYDKTPPSGVLAPPPIGVAGQPANIGYNTQDKDSGVDEVELWVQHNNGTWTKVTTTQSTTGLFSYTPQQPGTYNFYIRVKDKAGNWSGPMPGSNTLPSGTMQVPAPEPPGPEPTMDAGGAPDAGPADQGNPDNNTTQDQAGPQDTGGPSDAGNPTDTNAQPDASTTPDNNTTQDAGSPNDAGSPQDASPTDQGSTPDSGTNPDQTGTPDNGGAPDNGTTQDAGNTNDGGSNQEPPNDSSGTPDTNTTQDAGSPNDAGSPGDVGGTPDNGTTQDTGPSPDNNTTQDGGGTADQGVGNDASVQDQGTTPDTSGNTDKNNGQCQPLCSPGFRCVNGKCEEVNCYTEGCPDGQICRNAACISDPCDGVKCGASKFCREGQCVRSCGKVRCPGNQICVDGVCTTDQCLRKKCNAGEICCPSDLLCDLPGQCIPDPCAQANCQNGQVCETYSGRCIDDPCKNIRCPHKEDTCDLGQCRGPKLPPVELPDDEPGAEGTTQEESADEAAPDATTADSDESNGEGDELTSTKEDNSQDGLATQDKSIFIPPPSSGPDRQTALSGCGCQTEHNAPWGWLGLMLLFVLAAARRRQRSLPSQGKS